MDLGPSSTAESALGPERPEATWIGPIPDGHVLPGDGDPAELAVSRETISLAFVAALQHLPPRQRAVLILREVLRWKASEVADLLGTTVASVNSALERARSTLAASNLSASDPVQPLDEEQRVLVARFADAFERYDIESLVSLLHDDATQTMPPYEMWLRGPAEIGRWMLGAGIGCRGSRHGPASSDVDNERRPGVRAVPAQRPGRPPRTMGAPCPRAVSRPDHRDQRVPQHHEPVPALRPAPSARAVARL